MKITFLGAAREVTGSCYLLESGDSRILVDCGMFQGGREARRKNREALAFDPRDIDCVLVTHAHIDHSGLLPRLVALGFRGPIYATAATCDLLEVMLPDSAHIQEMEAERENRHRHRARQARSERSRGRAGAESVPLYTVAQAQDCLRRLRPVDYDTEFKPVPSMRCRLRDAGHILGSAILELWAEDHGAARKLVFSGDLGQPDRPIVRDPTPIAEADILLVESTYGNRLHKNLGDSETELIQAIAETLPRGGNLIVPAFAVGRTQEVLYILADLMRKQKISTDIEIIVDSPMATRATEITQRHLHVTDDEMRELMAWQKEKKNGRRPRIRFTESVEESMRLNDLRGAIIVSASGMCDAGRIKHHLRHNLPRAESGILITGFQAAGTLGRRLVDGARRVKIFGNDIAVRARLYTIGGLSAHADQAALLAWLGGFKKAPARTFVVHGEAATAQEFARLVNEKLGWPTEAPAPLASYTL
ncbi:MAG: MBL fold metallo-hydrolase [Gammaproteobacteria bacterium]|nr:MBL fold metallo-hydrolase [Gammaproteobacteria bacterium]MBU1645163.1 MBL fold metallo-hydrolase [Gammaproteobacteria bacterium]MBU1973400.1 MBL fold metallo-hydrolase [Gammaproteobacteria bacterium]